MADSDDTPTTPPADSPQQDPPAGDPPAPDTGAEPPSGDGGDGGDLAAEVEKWKALARKHEARAKQSHAAEQKLQELEDAKKSELEKATARADRAERARDEALARVMRAEVAARKGLTAEQAKRLQGNTEEELEADADELLAAFKPADKPSQDKPTGDRGADRAPRTKLAPGNVPNGEPPDETDPRKLIAGVSRNRF